MRKKTIVAVFGGIFAAGLLCLIVGLIVYFTANGNVMALIIGLFTIATGAIIAAAALLALLITFLVMLISRNKNK